MLSLALLMAAAQPAAPAAIPPRPVVAASSAPSVKQGVITLPSGLRFQTLEASTGPKPSENAAVLVTYEGKLADGTPFDASPQPVPFGVQDVIPGFTQALLMMNAGGRYRFWIPSSLAYGEAGAGNGAIPPNAELEFTVSLLDIHEPDPEPAPPAQ